MKTDVAMAAMVVGVVAIFVGSVAWYANEREKREVASPIVETCIQHHALQKVGLQ